MYIGLFFMIPVLNIVIDTVCNDRANRRWWLLLAGIYLLLTSVGSSLDVWGISVIPNYWRIGWILNYYVIGALIRRYCPTEPPAWFVKYRWVLYTLCVIFCLSNPILSVILHRDFVFMFMGRTAEVAPIILATTIFLSLYSVKACPMRKAVSCVSRCSLDMYLFSYIIDTHFYPQLRRLCSDQQRLLLYYIPSVAFLVFAAWLVSYIKERLFRLGRVPKILG